MPVPTHPRYRVTIFCAGADRTAEAAAIADKANAENADG
jgi:hypothetical protein